jgi:hypothetical protein
MPLIHGTTTDAFSVIIKECKTCIYKGEQCLLCEDGSNYIPTPEIVQNEIDKLQRLRLLSVEAIKVLKREKAAKRGR